MKVSRWLLLCILVAGLSSCMWGVKNKQPTAAIAKDTLVYSYKSIKEQNTGHKKTDSTDALISMFYPFFNNAPLLNAYLKINDTDITKFKKSFFESYEKEKSDISTGLPSYESKDSITVIRQDSSLITIQINAYRYFGGAHGVESTGFVNWDIKANKSLELDDILTPGYVQQLTQIGEAIFRKDEKLSATASLADDYFFKDSKFSLNKTFLITPLGLKFLYNEYEIKPFAAGQTELFIPYSQIKSLLKPNMVISQYHK